MKLSTACINASYPVFRVTTDTTAYQRNLASAVAKTWPGAKKVYIIGPDYEYGRTMWELFKTRMKEQNPKAEFTGARPIRMTPPHWPVTVGGMSSGSLTSSPSIVKVIGADTVIAAQAGIGGSARIGSRVMIGGQTGLVEARAVRHAAGIEHDDVCGGAGPDHAALAVRAVGLPGAGAG